MEDVQGEGIYKKYFCEGLKPEEVLTVSEWADKYRMLSAVSSSEPGKWKTSRTPYLREIMDCLSSHDPTQEVVFMKGAQVGATEMGINWIAYIIDHVPAPTLFIQPTVDMAKRASKQRIAPLIESNVRLQDKVKAPKARDSGNTVLQKDFPGGTLLLTGANSAVGLRSMPAKNLFLDEVDGYPGDLDGEGDPIDLAKARQRTFAKKKRLLVSTPTIHGLSKIEPAFERSDRRYFHVPCPHCNAYQKLIFSNLVFNKNDIKEVHYACEECGELIEEHYKTDMLAAGKWIAENPVSSVAGFHLNSLYSPLGWFSWFEIANEWKDSYQRPEKLKGFINTILGETWKETGEVPDWERLYERRTKRPMNVVPVGGLFLTAGVDVQKDRLEMEIVAWGRDFRSWSIDYRVFPGDTAEDEVWKALDEVLVETWKVENSRTELSLRAMGIDSGYLTQRVYAYCRSKGRGRVFATKGMDQLTQVIGSPKAVDVNLRGKRIARGTQLWPVGVSMLKSELYGFLRLARGTEETPPIGYCDFPEYGEEFFKMLTAEQLVIRKVRGYNKPEWQKTRDRNEALDVRVIARAMASLVGLDRFKDRHFEKLEKEAGTTHTVGSNQQNTPRKSPKIKRKKSDWL